MTRGRPLGVQVSDSPPFTRKSRRITVQAKTRPSRHGGPGSDEQDDAVRPGDRPAAMPGSAASGIDGLGGTAKVLKNPFNDR
jgi:hypothetical protein